MVEQALGQVSAASITDKRSPDCPRANFSHWWQLISPCVNPDPKKVPQNCTNRLMPSNATQSKINATINDFAAFLKDNETVKKLGEKMWDDVPQKLKEFCPGDMNEMIKWLRVSTTVAPQFLNGAADWLGVPILTTLNCYFHSLAGRKFWEDHAVNEKMRNIVNAWSTFLNSKESLSVFNKGQFGWMSKCALDVLNISQFDLPDPNATAWGFNSWNDFFTRPFKNVTKSRPIACPDDNNVMTTFGDVGPDAVRFWLDLQNDFYIKNSEYSLLDVFDGDEATAQQYVGGTAAQFYFAATSYHRYHSAVSGTVMNRRIKNGTLFAVSGKNVFDNLESMKRGTNLSLSQWIDEAGAGMVNTEMYLTQAANTCILEVYNEDLGNVTQVFIGMTEISSCTLDPKATSIGMNITKGQEIGMFQFGGSSGVVFLTKKAFEEQQNNCLKNVYHGTNVSFSKDDNQLRVAWLFANLTEEEIYSPRDYQNFYLPGDEVKSLRLDKKLFPLGTPIFDLKCRTGWWNGTSPAEICAQK